MLSAHCLVCQGKSFLVLWCHQHLTYPVGPAGSPKPQVHKLHHLEVRARRQQLLPTWSSCLTWAGWELFPLQSHGCRTAVHGGLKWDETTTPTPAKTRPALNENVLPSVNWLPLAVLNRNPLKFSNSQAGLFGLLVHYSWFSSSLTNPPVRTQRER